MSKKFSLAALFRSLAARRELPSRRSRRRLLVERCEERLNLSGDPAEVILFSSGPDNSEEIYFMQPDGTGVTALTNNAVRDYDPALSPDGTKIAYVSTQDDASGAGEIFVMNADGSGATRLTNNSSEDIMPVWTPDGRLVFSSSRDGDLDIYVMNADGTAQTNLTNNSVLDMEPTVRSTDGRIAFISDRVGGLAVFTMNADGSGLSAKLSDATYSATPAWSPDGTRIAFGKFVHQGGFADPNMDVFVMNADGSNHINLTSTGSNTEDEAEPAWSPDGAKIAYAKETDSTGPGLSWLDIFVMNADGSNKTQLTANPGQHDRYAAWGILAVHEDPATVSITASDATAAEPTDHGQFTVSLDGGKVAGSGGVSVTYSVGGTAGSGDYAALSGVVVIDAGTSSAVINVVVQDDNVVEDVETVVITLTGAAAVNGDTVSVNAAGSQAVVTIADNDFIGGGGTSDTIEVGGGDHNINAGGGNDSITVSGHGNNTILTGSGADTVLITGNGDNVITTGGGSDTVTITGTGNNTVTGNGGTDTITTGSGHDTIHGGGGADIVNAGGGDDTVNGGGGDDTIHAGGGDDVLDGDGGRDQIFAEAGDDIIVWDDKDTLIDGGSGADLLLGDAGKDTLDLRTSAISSIEAVLTAAGNDKVTLSAAALAATPTKAFVALMGSGNDTLVITGTAGMTITTTTATPAEAIAAIGATGQVANALSANSPATLFKITLTSGGDTVTIYTDADVRTFVAAP